jgi:hypothetical protein
MKQREPTINSFISRIHHRDDILLARDEFSSSITDGAKELKLSKELKSNAEIIESVSQRQSDFASRMTAQTAAMSVSDECNIFSMLIE